MGIDLKVLASSFRERAAELVPTATLLFERDAELFSTMSIDSTPCIVRHLPDGLKVGCYEDSGLVFRQNDKYERPLTFTTSAGISNLKCPKKLTSWNAAILDFLKVLPVTVRIVLYWH